jgi:uncharacterized protein (TIGR01244 family)
MKYVFLFLIILGASALIFPQSIDQIPNLHQVQYDIYTSGQPTEEGFHQIAEMGIKTVINVLPEKECVRDEPMMVAMNDMFYRTVPFELSSYKMERIQRFAEILKNAEKPVLIHCSTGNHVGGMWFAYRAIEENAPLDQALKEGREIGMKRDLEDSIYLWIISYNLRS